MASQKPAMVWKDDNPTSNGPRKKGLKAPIGSPGYEHTGSNPGPPKQRTPQQMTELARRVRSARGRGG